MEEMLATRSVLLALRHQGESAKLSRKAPQRKPPDHLLQDLTQKVDNAELELMNQSQLTFAGHRGEAATRAPPAEQRRGACGRQEGGRHSAAGSEAGAHSRGRACAGTRWREEGGGACFRWQGGFIPGGGRPDGTADGAVLAAAPCPVCV